MNAIDTEGGASAPQTMGLMDFTNSPNPNVFSGNYREENPNPLMFELPYGHRHFMQPLIHLRKDRVRLVLSRRQPLSRMSAGKNLNPLLYRRHRIQMKTSLGHRLHHFVVQH